MEPRRYGTTKHARPRIVVRMSVFRELFGSKGPFLPANNREINYTREVFDFLTGEPVAPGTHFTSIEFMTVDRDDHALFTRIMTALQRVGADAIDRRCMLQFVVMLNRSKQSHQAEDRVNGLLPPLEDDDSPVFT